MTGMKVWDWKTVEVLMIIFWMYFNINMMSKYVSE